MDPNITKHSSVRVTLRISDTGDLILNELVKHYQVSQKELFYRIAEILDDLSINELTDLEDKSPKKPKTMVLPQLALDSLMSNAERLNTHRDDILGAALNFLYLYNKNEKQKVNEMKEHLSELSSVVSNIDAIMMEKLGNDHPITERVGMISVITDNLLMSVESHLEYGSHISPDDMTDTGGPPILKEQFSKETVNTDGHRIFIKRYKSKVPNVSKSLTKTISINKIKSKLSNPEMMNKVEDFKRLSFWDFGVKATKYLQKGDLVWIVTGDSYYKGKIVALFDDPDGQICDAIGWARQFKQPWKTPVALTDVEEVQRVPDTIRQAMLKPHVTGIREFFAISES